MINDNTQQYTYFWYWLIWDKIINFLERINSNVNFIRMQMRSDKAIYLPMRGTATI